MLNIEPRKPFVCVWCAETEPGPNPLLHLLHRLVPNAGLQQGCKLPVARIGQGFRLSLSHKPGQPPHNVVTQGEPMMYGMPREPM